MARNRKSVPVQLSTLDSLFRRVVAILEQARARAVRAVNTEMVIAYWHIGREIIEHEQGGRRRAAYGEAVLDELSRRLTMEFGRGFDVTNLRKMRQFYRMYEIRDALRLESDKAKRDAARLVSGRESILQTACGELSWSHYRLLMQVENPRAREWYMNEAADQRWSTRQLERQISVLYYERLLASRKKAPVRKEARVKLAAVAPEEFIRDPYVLEFLNLKDYPALRESAVEQAIIDNLQAFLLELGKGFSFVARHKKNSSSELSISGVEKTDETGRLCRMNLAVHGLEGDIRHGGEVNSCYDASRQATEKFDLLPVNHPIFSKAVSAAQ